MLALRFCECEPKPWVTWGTDYGRLAYPGGLAIGCLRCGRPREDLLVLLIQGGTVTDDGEMVRVTKMLLDGMMDALGKAGVNMIYTEDTANPTRFVVTVRPAEKPDDDPTEDLRLRPTAEKPEGP